jgi:stage II sporulation protein P
MPAGRYNHFSKQRVSARYRSLKKRPQSRDIISLIIILGLTLVIILSSSPFSAPVVFNIANFKTVIAEGLQLDYITLICQSLPGMRINAATKENNVLPLDDAGPDLRLPIQAYPQIFLHNELAGFKVVEVSKLYQASFYGDYQFDDDTGIMEGELQPEQGEEGVSFLLDKRSDIFKEKPFIIKDDKPMILIYHTHATESFIPLSGKTFCEDPELTVVSLGAYLAELLEKEHGIPVLHCKEIFDIPRRYAYEKARPSIEQVLEQNPQIQVVLDLHRDGVSRQVTTAGVTGKDTAKILFVIGTRHEGWYNNLRFALFLEKAMGEKYPGLSRDIRKHAFIYNQDLHPRSLIVEIGGHENNRDEITRAVSCFAEVLASAFH